MTDPDDRPKLRFLMDEESAVAGKSTRIRLFMTAPADFTWHQQYSELAVILRAETDDVTIEPAMVKIDSTAGEEGGAEVYFTAIAAGEHTILIDVFSYSHGFGTQQLRATVCVIEP